MKSLSIRQPWAWLIVNGFKDVENRTWKSSFRGSLLIHASKTVDYFGYDYITSKLGVDLPHHSLINRGGIVGFAEITDCVLKYNSKWFTGPYGFLIRDPKPLEFIPLQGKLGFFDVPETVNEITMQ